MIRALCLAGVLLAASAAADPAEAEKKTLDVSSSASLTSAYDSIAVTIGIETDASTFGKSRAAAEAVFDRVRAEVEKLGLPGLQFRDDFLVLRQSGVAFGDRGAKMAHRLTIESSRLAADTLHPTVISVVDTALALDKKLVVVAIEASLSSAALDELRESLIARATATAKSDAEKLAESMRVRLGQLVSLDWEFSGDAQQSRRDYRPGIEAMTVGGSQLVKTRRSFELDEPFVSRVTYKAGVRASFELMR